MIRFSLYHVCVGICVRGSVYFLHFLVFYPSWCLQKYILWGAGGSGKVYCAFCCLVIQEGQGFNRSAQHTKKCLTLPQNSTTFILKTASKI